jgi:hypothetical protein
VDTAHQSGKFIWWAVPTLHQQTRQCRTHAKKTGLNEPGSREVLIQDETIKL